MKKFLIYSCLAFGMCLALAGCDPENNWTETEHSTITRVTLYNGAFKYYYSVTNNKGDSLGLWSDQTFHVGDEVQFSLVPKK